MTRTSSFYTKDVGDDVAVLMEGYQIVDDAKAMTFAIVRDQEGVIKVVYSPQYQTNGDVFCEPYVADPKNS